jgi:hypothetical protein
MGVNDLKGFDYIGEASLSEQLKTNVIEFFDWALLEKGNFYNVNVPSSGQYGGPQHKLRLVDDPNYTSGQVWESHRGNWVWQSGLRTNQANVIQKAVQSGTYPKQKSYPGVSGVFVGEAFTPTSGVGAHAHHIDYKNGRVIFDSAIATTSTVSLSYSYKWVNVTSANNIPWFRELQSNSLRRDSDHFNLIGSGDWSQLGQTRFQLPAIAIEVVPRRTMKPYQIGGGQYVTTDVLFHIITEEEYTRDKLVDVITLQKEKAFHALDVNRMARKAAFPLDYRGMTVSGAPIYPILVAHSGNGGYRWTDGIEGGKILFTETGSSSTTILHPSLYTGVVRTSMEVILPGI